MWEKLEVREGKDNIFTQSLLEDIQILELGLSNQKQKQLYEEWTRKPRERSLQTYSPQHSWKLAAWAGILRLAVWEVPKIVGCSLKPEVMQALVGGSWSFLASWQAGQIERDAP